MEKLRENFIFDRTITTRLTESEIKANPKLSSLKEQYESYDFSQEMKSLRESLQEAEKSELDKVLANLKEVGARNDFSVWKIPIGRYGNMNGNKRIYPKKLWENIKEKQQDTWKGFCGLCDHPVADNDPGEFKNQAIVWHDMDIGDSGIVFGYGSFVGPFGHLAQEILEHGGKVGTSSSGFGDVDKYTHEVDPETYIIERLADLVLNPSQGTFGTPECTHTANDFMKNVHAGATIEFNKQKVREAQSAIIGRKNMADNLKFDAAAQQQKSAAPQGGAQTQAPAPAQGGQTGAAPAQNGQQQKESEQMSQKGTLTKIEEKAFRKYVDTFIKDADSMLNPIQRLNECMDILSCFDEGNCPDLKQQLEKKLLQEKADLEKLVEKVVTTEKDYEMPIEQFREAAERNTAQGLLLNEQVSDYKELCEGLAARNKKLNEEVVILRKKLNIQSKLTEKKLYQTNKEIVTTTSEAEKLAETVTELKTKNSVLMERISKLSLSNKEFEKENGLLVTKIKEAGEIMKNVKIKEAKELQEKNQVASGIKKLQEEIVELKSINSKLQAGFEAQTKEFKKLEESYNNYKKEVNDTYNPTAGLMPKFEERVGKYLNLRENKGIEVEAYWGDLLNKYGENVAPYEQQIRGAKTLKEATNNFLKFRTQIDPDFAVAQPAEYAYRNKSERAKLYEHQGITNPVDSYQNASVEKKNEEFLDGLKKMGWN